MYSYALLTHLVQALLESAPSAEPLTRCMGQLELGPLLGARPGVIWKLAQACICTACAPHVPRMCTACAPHVHRMCTACARALHGTHTARALCHLHL